MEAKQLQSSSSSEAVAERRRRGGTRRGGSKEGVAQRRGKDGVAEIGGTREATTSREMRAMLVHEYRPGAASSASHWPASHMPWVPFCTHAGAGNQCRPEDLGLLHCRGAAAAGAPGAARVGMPRRASPLCLLLRPRQCSGVLC